MSWIGKLVAGFALAISSIFGGSHVSPLPVATTTPSRATEQRAQTSSSAADPQTAPVSTRTAVFTPSVVTQTSQLPASGGGVMLVGTPNCFAPSVWALMKSTGMRVDSNAPPEDKSCVVPEDIANTGNSYLRQQLGPEYVSKYLTLSTDDSESITDPKGHSYWKLHYNDSRFKQLTDFQITYTLDIDSSTKAVTAESQIPDCIRTPQLCQVLVNKQQSLDEAALNGFQTSATGLIEGITVGGPTGPGWSWALMQRTRSGTTCTSRTLSINIGTGTVSPLGIGTSTCPLPAMPSF